MTLRPISFTALDLLDPAFNDRMREISEAHLQATEAALTKAVVQIEGRMPSNDEIKLHGQKLMWPSGKVVWTWKGQTILEQEPIYKPSHELQSQVRVGKGAITRIEWSPDGAPSSKTQG